MKRLSVLILAFSLSLFIMVSCNSSSNEQLSSQIDSLKNQMKAAYIPGTGEIMNSIVQPHHYKLWLAGQKQNWTLAEYERHQLLGGFKRIEKYHKGTPEAAAVPMIYPEMKAVEIAISQKDEKAFNNHFVLLTNMCNTCHQATKYEFNVISVPTVTNFGNQHF
ncbi:MAG: hypothetical protein M3O71_04980 [Bacteroidota bacterium]|nr:hypothetical protein [Bacteroidota bacterium]